MHTFSQEEIRRQIAQAEIDAQFRNDPDAARNASKSPGESLILHGTISSRRAINPVPHINEVAVHMTLTLVRMAAALPTPRRPRNPIPAATRPAWRCP
jgi:hypothetical protein